MLLKITVSSNIIWSDKLCNGDAPNFINNSSRARSEPGGTRWRTGGEVKGKLANGVGSQYSHATSERGLTGITQADAHTSAASSRLDWRLHRFKWTRPFRGKTKSGFCPCAIRFRTSYIKIEPKRFGQGLLFLQLTSCKIARIIIGQFSYSSTLKHPVALVVHVC